MKSLQSSLQCMDEAKPMKNYEDPQYSNISNEGINACFHFREYIHFGSTIPTTWFNLLHASGELKQKSDVFLF